MTTNQNEVALAYSQTARRTVVAGPLLLVRLYDRLAHELELAKAYIGEGNPMAANDSLQHAQKIVHVLRSSLDPDGFEGGQMLVRLYNTVIEQLVKANLYKDIAAIECCQDIVGPLHAAWTEAVAREMQGSVDSAVVGVG